MIKMMNGFAARFLHAAFFCQLTSACVLLSRHQLTDNGVSQKLPSMGSFFELQVVVGASKGAPPAPLPQSLFVEIQRQLDQLESELSLYQPGSAIRKLNREGVVHDVSADFVELILLSKKAFHESQGAFDITILPVLNLIEKSFAEHQRPPELFQVDALRGLVNSDLVSVDVKKREIRLLKKGMQITLDGIAKGYAVDRVADYLESKGYTNYLLNFSGNMRWRGRRADGELWNIQVWHPEDQALRPLKPSLAGAVATSGVEHRHYSKDARWNHLIDPRTLRPAQGVKTYTAEQPLAVDADIQSTVGFLRVNSSP